MASKISIEAQTGLTWPETSSEPKVFCSQPGAREGAAAASVQSGGQSPSTVSLSSPHSHPAASQPATGGRQQTGRNGKITSE